VDYTPMNGKGRSTPVRNAKTISRSYLVTAVEGSYKYRVEYTSVQ